MNPDHMRALIMSARIEIPKTTQWQQSKFIMVPLTDIKESVCRYTTQYLASTIKRNSAAWFTVQYTGPEPGQPRSKTCFMEDVMSKTTALLLRHPQHEGEERIGVDYGVDMYKNIERTEKGVTKTCNTIDSINALTLKS